ncbi:hypothetical protein J421_2855 [Gemmatirosa kalamazoonensis]|jgi:hypothetical protein|uniref:Uncharacterized protein n=1 Tax=Gemmatirosa kalamazoonensis TaxID=861299 RepID=W0RIX9_9BACT|nr:hypothetical protein [Gemmatirosa kalamazoonensis]AHG90392.1 hypothetical protein J421_2855 [Gemmatirosa kalamazoonensis]
MIGRKLVMAPIVAGGLLLAAARVGAVRPAPAPAPPSPGLLALGAAALVGLGLRARRERATGLDDWRPEPAKEPVVVQRVE